LTEIRDNLRVQGHDGTDKWVDICGMFSPVRKIESLVDSVRSGKIASITQVNEFLQGIFNDYDTYAWEWCSDMIGRIAGTEPENIPVDGLINIISEWKINAIKFNNMILRDAEKEFDSSARIGFGVDGDDNTKEKDFEVVRGAYSENKFVTGLQKETASIEEKADRLIALLERMQ
jgi:hypothetical protein